MSRHVAKLDDTGFVHLIKKLKLTCFWCSSSVGNLPRLLNDNC